MVEAEGRTFPFDGPEKVTQGVLETFPYEYPQREAEVVIASQEWSCVCPYSGLPDYGTVRITYVPDRVCVELKSLKYYLTSFRNVGIYQEHAANRVLDDLVAACRPRRMEVVLDYHLRGGLHTVVTCRWP
jgi:7-cyano-7-deazaguanine reductase